MAQARKRASTIMEQDDVPDVSKVREIEKIYAKAKSAARGKRREIKHVVARKFHKGNAGGPSVDKRMLADRRGALKAKGGVGKGRGGRGGGGRQRRRQRAREKSLLMRRMFVVNRKDASRLVSFLLVRTRSCRLEPALSLVVRSARVFARSLSLSSRRPVRASSTQSPPFSFSFSPSKEKALFFFLRFGALGPSSRARPLTLYTPAASRSPARPRAAIMNCGPLTAALFRVWFTSFTRGSPAATRASASPVAPSVPELPGAAAARRRRERNKAPSFFCCCPDSSLCCPRFSAAFFPSSAPPSAPPSSVSLWTLLSYPCARRRDGAVVPPPGHEPHGEDVRKLELARAPGGVVSPRATMTTAPATRGARRGEGDHPPRRRPASPATRRRRPDQLAPPPVVRHRRRRRRRLVQATRAPRRTRVPRSVSGRRSGGGFSWGSRRGGGSAPPRSRRIPIRRSSRSRSLGASAAAERSSSSSDPDDASSDARRRPRAFVSRLLRDVDARASSFASVAARFASSSSGENRYLGGSSGGFAGPRPRARPRLEESEGVSASHRLDLLHPGEAVARGGGASPREGARGERGEAARALLSRSSFSSFFVGGGKTRSR